MNKILKLKKKDGAVLMPLDKDGNYELYLPAATIDPKNVPEVVEIGSGGQKQVLHVNISAPVKHRHLSSHGERIQGDHDRLFVMTEELKAKIEKQIEGEEDEPTSDNA